MKTERRYVLIFCETRKHIRIFRADCEVRPAGEVLWEGDGLRATYDAMVRLNGERKPPVVYLLCHRLSRKRTDIFRIFRSVVDGGWDTVSMHTSRKEALAARAEAPGVFAARREAEDALLLRRLHRVGVKAATLPRLTDKDRRYLDWIESRRDLFEDAA